MIVYLSGPMTGLPDMNYPAFNAAEARLTALGYDVINPARPGDSAWGWTEFMRRALVDLSQADGIHVLPGWRNSKGASVEVFIADALGLERVEEDA